MPLAGGVLWSHHGGSGAPVAAVAVALVAAPRACSADGEMLWSKTGTGNDEYKLCYAPSLTRDNPGPTGAHLQCEPHSYFMIEVPKFCCRNPRLDIGGGSSAGAAGEVCGDLLAEFDPNSQRIHYTRWPVSTASPEQQAELYDSGLGSKVPSPIALREKGNSAWKPVMGMKCSGRFGTLIKWLHGEPAGRAEFCPTGTKPVQGAGYASWACDGTYTKERLLHCCKANGQIRCVKTFFDNTNRQSCNCEVYKNGAAPLLLPALVAGAISGGGGTASVQARRAPRNRGRGAGSSCRGGRGDGCFL